MDSTFKKKNNGVKPSEQVIYYDPYQPTAKNLHSNISSSLTHDTYQIH